MPRSATCILSAYTLDGTGSGQRLKDEDEITEKLRSEDLAWVHLERDHPKTREWLTKNVSYLDPSILDALLADETRPRLLEFETGVMMILRGVNLNENEDPEDMVSIRVWIDEHRIISLRRRKLKAAQDIAERVEAGKGPKNAGDFSVMLTSVLFDRMAPVLTDLDQRTDDAEEEVIETPDASLRAKITDIRKQAILFRRYIAPQRDVLSMLRVSDQKWLAQTHRRYLQENGDRLLRYVEDLDAVRERAAVIKDELANILSDRLNKNMYLLSIIAAIFLPLGFLTGLLGINVGGIPGSDNPDAFYIFSGILTALVLVQVILFRKLRWF